MSWVDFPSLLGTYYILHQLLRFRLRPVLEELCKLPEFMQPTLRQRSSNVLYWFTFMPWPHVREKMQINQFRHKDIDIQLYIARNYQLLWPYGAAAAISFDHNECKGVTSLLIPPHSRCTCPGPWITDKFKEIILKVENWGVRKGADPANKFPELRSVEI